MYESCYVHGADGLAFVIQSDPNGTAALGNGGGQHYFRRLCADVVSQIFPMFQDRLWWHPVVHRRASAATHFDGEVSHRLSSTWPIIQAPATWSM